MIKWRNEWNAQFKAEGDSLCIIEIESVADSSAAVVKLSITHSAESLQLEFIDTVSGGWPRILSNLKSLLETGTIILESKPAPPAAVQAAG